MGQDKGLPEWAIERSPEHIAKVGREIAESFTSQKDMDDFNFRMCVQLGVLKELAEAIRIIGETRGYPGQGEMGEAVNGLFAAQRFFGAAGKVVQRQAIEAVEVAMEERKETEQWTYEWVLRVLFPQESSNDER